MEAVVMWVELLVRLEVLVTLAVLVGVLKSFYNGFLYDLKHNTNRIPELADKQDAMRTRQDRMSDVLIALSYAESDQEGKIDPESVKDVLNAEDRLGALFEEGEPPPRVRYDTEDEKEDESESREVDAGLGPERQEP